MLKKLLLGAVTICASIGFAFAEVDVNKADQAALDGIKGVGPKLSQSILDARKQGGNFKDWADFEKRVKGVGDKNSLKLSQAGLTINGQAKAAGASADAAAKPRKSVQLAANERSSAKKDKPAAAAAK